MLNSKEIDATCEVNAYRLYELLMVEAEYFALFNGGVTNWEHYNESLSNYATTCGYNPFGKTKIPDEAIGNFKKFADWESTEIVRQYIKEESK